MNIQKNWLDIIPTDVYQNIYKELFKKTLDIISKINITIDTEFRLDNGTYNEVIRSDYIISIHYPSYIRSFNLLRKQKKLFVCYTNNNNSILNQLKNLCPLELRELCVENNLYNSNFKSRKKQKLRKLLMTI